MNGSGWLVWPCTDRIEPACPQVIGMMTPRYIFDKLSLPLDFGRFFLLIFFLYRLKINLKFGKLDHASISPTIPLNHKSAENSHLKSSDRWSLFNVKRDLIISPSDLGTYRNSSHMAALNTLIPTYIRLHQTSDKN